MSYTPKEWVCGETITADGLNNIEEGIQEALDCCGGGEPFVVTFTYDEDSESYTADKTFAEITQAIADGRLVYGMWGDDYYVLTLADSSMIALSCTASDDGPEIVSDTFRIDNYDTIYYSRYEAEQQSQPHYMVRFTKSGSVYSCDTSYSDILDIMDGGTEVIAVYEDTGNDTYSYFCMTSVNQNRIQWASSDVYIYGLATIGRIRQLELASDDTASYMQATFTSTN